MVIRGSKERSRGRLIVSDWGGRGEWHGDWEMARTAWESGELSPPHTEENRMLEHQGSCQAWETVYSTSFVTVKGWQQCQGVAVCGFNLNLSFPPLPGFLTVLSALVKAIEQRWMSLNSMSWVYNTSSASFYLFPPPPCINVWKEHSFGYVQYGSAAGFRQIASSLWPWTSWIITTIVAFPV